MSCDIHIFLETYDQEKDRWELTKGKIESVAEIIESKLQKVHSDEEKYLESVFNGYKDSLESELEKFYHHPNWVGVPRNYTLFALLSDIRNENLAIPHIFKSPHEDSYELEIPENISEETQNLMNDPSFHSHTLLKPDDLDEIDELMLENLDDGCIDKEEFHKMSKQIDDSFGKAVRQYKEKGYSEKQMRFFIVYDD